jgi:hypothetical protein
MADNGQERAMPFSVQLIILSCEADLALTRKFVIGFDNVRAELQRPIVLIDQSGSPRLSAQYLQLVVVPRPLRRLHAPARAKRVDL